MLLSFHHESFEAVATAASAALTSIDRVTGRTGRSAVGDVVGQSRDALSQTAVQAVARRWRVRQERREDEASAAAVQAVQLAADRAGDWRLLAAAANRHVAAGIFGPGSEESIINLYFFINKTCFL